MKWVCHGKNESVGTCPQAEAPQYTQPHASVEPSSRSFEQGSERPSYPTEADSHGSLVFDASQGWIRFLKRSRSHVGGADVGTGGDGPVRVARDLLASFF